MGVYAFYTPELFKNVTEAELEDQSSQIMILSIQYMRGIASLLVVIQHAAWKVEVYSTDTLSYWNIGRAGVDLFFIISGYIMCHVTHERQINLKSFLLARVRRIIPLYWFLTTAALIIFLIMPDMVNSSGGNTNVLNSYTLWPTHDKYLIQNGWTLSYEFYFYLLFSLSLYLTHTRRYFIPLATIFILVVAGDLFPSRDAFFDLATKPLLIEFGCGIMIFHWRNKILGKTTLGKALVIIAFISFIIVNNTDWWYSRVINYGIPCMLLFIGMLALEPWFQKLKKSQLSQLGLKLGDSSYSLYLSHPFTLVLCSIIMSKLGINQIGILFTTLLILGSFVAGYLCYVLVELNLAKLIKRACNKNTN